MRGGRSATILYRKAVSLPRTAVRAVLISQKVFIAMLVWTTVSVLIALASGIEVLVTLILIGLLVIRELTDSFLTKEIRMRMDFFIYAGLILFVVVVLRRVLLVLS
jgi:hypothetical protein